jgi:L,D-peptidoglycan transpeptidase YkuD (ErfK/YbiS/YcfS/YnhG family)
MKPTLLLIALAFAAPAFAAPLPWADARQMILVVTPDSEADQGAMTTWERTGGAWRLAAPAAPVTVGRAGSAWGLGLHPPQAGRQKHEGDGRAPAGVFDVGPAFGYAPSLETAMTYLPMTASHWCIDVTGSPLYNRIVDAAVVGEAAVKGSTEPMRRDLHAGGDRRYATGFVIAHNPGNADGAGSCIFAHAWKAPGEATAGCTAMDEATLAALAGWIDPAAHPVFVLLARADYDRLARGWQLPDVALANPHY